MPAHHATDASPPMRDDTHELQGEVYRIFLHSLARSPDGIVTRRASTSLIEHMLEEWRRLRRMDYASLVTLKERLAARHGRLFELLRNAPPENHDAILMAADHELRWALHFRGWAIDHLIRYIEEVGPEVPEAPPRYAVEEMKEHVTNAQWVDKAMRDAPKIVAHLPSTSPVAARVLHVMCELAERFGYDSDPARDWQPVTSEVKDTLAETLKRYVGQIRSVSQISDDLTCARKVASEMTSEVRKRIGRTRPEPPM